MLLCLAISSLSAVALAGGDDDVVRNQLTAGADFIWSPNSQRAELELVAAERLRAEAFEGNGFDGELRADLRGGYRVLVGRFGETRARELMLRMHASDWQLDIGRIPVDGGYRLVDGVAAWHALGPVHLGAWGGLGPDPYTTAPSLSRFGGGPTLSWATDALALNVLGEVWASSGGLDRASAVTDLRFDPTRDFELSGRLDLQHRGSVQPVALAEGLLTLWGAPHPNLRLSGLYDAYSGLAWLSTEQQDPGLTRFAARSSVVDPAGTNAQDTLDSSLYQLVGGTVSLRPEIGGLHWVASVRGRYRYHALPDRRYARLTLQQGVLGLAEGTVDLSLDQSLLWWGQSGGWMTGAGAVLRPLSTVDWSLDTSFQLGRQPLFGSPTQQWGTWAYLDGFVDLYRDGLGAVSAGYTWSRSMDLEQWDVHHAMFLRATWGLTVQRPELNPEVHASSL